jgi:hypothetical protein
MWLILIGAVLVIGGFLYLFRQALSRRLSEPHESGHGSQTLEPQHQGLRFLGLSKNWPGIVTIALGALLLAFGGYL